MALSDVVITWIMVELCVILIICPDMLNCNDVLSSRLEFCSVNQTDLCMALVLFWYYL